MRNIKLILFILPVVMAFFCINYFGVNIPYLDDWSFVNLYLSFKEGTAGVQDIIFASYGEHMTGICYIIIFLSSFITGYNTKILLLLNLSALLILFFVIVIYSIKEFKLSIYNLPFWFMPIPYLLFSWAQSDNMLISFYFIMLMSITFSILSLYLCQEFIRRENQNNAILLFGLMCISSIAATFSMISGLFVWPIVIGNLMLFGRKRKYKIIYLFVFVIVFVSYIGMRPIYNHTNPSYIFKIIVEYLSNPIYSITYLISLFGAFANFHCYIISSVICFISGAVVLILILMIAWFRFIIKRKNLYCENVFLCSVIIYCIIVHFSIFYKNCHAYMGLAFFLPSRYSSVNIILIIFVYLFYIRIFIKREMLAHIINYIAMILLFICLLHYLITPFTYIQHLSEKKRDSIFTLLNYKNEPNYMFYPIAIEDTYNIGLVRLAAPLMEKYQMSIFNIRYLKGNYPFEYSLKYEKSEEIERLQKNDFIYENDVGIIPGISLRLLKL